MNVGGGARVDHTRLHGQHGGWVVIKSCRSRLTALVSGGRDARAKTLMILASVLVVAGSVILGTTMSAFAAGTMTGSPTTGLTNGRR